MAYDAEIRVGTNVDTSKMQKLQIQINKATDRAAQLVRELNELKNKEIPTDEYKELQKQIEAAELKLNRLLEKRERFTGSHNSAYWRNLNSEIEELQNSLPYLQGELQDLVDTGRAFVLGENTEEYVRKSRELAYVQANLRALNTRQEELIAKERRSADGFKRIGSSAKKAFLAINKGTKRSDGFLKSFGGRIKGLALSLLIFNQISKAFNVMASDMKEGFQSLVKYSDEYNSSMSELVSANERLKNSLATAFVPLVNMVIPYLTSFINMLSEAAAKVAQFIAAVTGKTSYTRAVKVQKDYRKELEGTAEAAEDVNGSLAQFDKLNVINQNKDSSGGGSGGSDEDLFEEVPIDSGILDFLDKMKSFLKPIIDYAKQLKDIFMQGFWDGLGDWEYRWQSIKNSLSSIKNNLIDIWTDPAVLSAADGWAKSLAYMLGSFAGSVTSIGLTIATNLVGGISNYLNQNKDRIKKHLVSMFDIWEDINNLLSGLFQSIAYVFEAFASEDGQQLTANILGIFTDMFMGITEFLSKYVHDKFNMLTQWFVDNKEAFRTALEGFLSVLSKVAGTIKQGIDDTFDNLNQMYDEHIKPFFDSVSQGISDLVAKFMEFWNEKVQPMLEEWGQKFDTLWKEHIQPSINKIIDAVGRVYDSLKKLWEESLKPLAEWIIANVLPVLLPIANEIFNTFLELVDWTISGISDLADIIADCVEIVVDLLTGDWSGAWESACDIVSTIWNRITTTISGAVNKIIGWIDELLGLFGKVQTEGAGLAALGVGTGAVKNITGSSKMTQRNVNIPKLASGSVIRGGHPFLTILGDQPAGHTNVEAPLSTIKQALKEGLRESGTMGGGMMELNVYLEGKQIYQEVLKQDRIVKKSTGSSGFLK